MRGAGGTPGGLGAYLAGFAMVVAGGYRLLTRVTVTSGLWQIWGYNAFGRSLPGWLLTAAGAIIILAGIIANLHLYFRPASLFDTLLILILLAGGLGLVARSLRAQSDAAPGRYPAAE